MDLLEKTHYFRRVLFHQQVQVVDYLALMVVTLTYTWQKNMWLTSIFGKLQHQSKIPSHGSKKSPTGPTEWTPKPEYHIALATYLGVRWYGPIQFLMEWMDRIFFDPFEPSDFQSFPTTKGSAGFTWHAGWRTRDAWDASLTGLATFAYAQGGDCCVQVVD